MSEPAAVVTARLIKGAELAPLGPAIHALARNAHTPNPHALITASQPSATAIAAFDVSGALVGFWPLAEAKPALSMLRAPPVPLFEIAGYPLVADGLEAAVMAALIGEAMRMKRLLLVRNMVGQGPLWEALQQLHKAGAMRVTVITQWERALLSRAAAASAEAYLTTALSSSTRKRMRAKRRALESEIGELQLSVHEVPEQVEAGLRHYLELEAAGWKGKSGTALAQKPGDEAFVRRCLQQMASAHSAMVAELRCSDRVIAAGLLLRAGSEVFFWKTTYDEALSKQSPGVILDMMLTDWLYAQPWFERLDTASDDTVDPSTLIWAERRTMAHVLIEPTGSSWRGRALLAYYKLRQRAKVSLKRLRG